MNGKKSRTHAERFEDALEEMIEARLAEVRGQTVQASEVCQFSRDRTKAGCSGGCHFCTDGSAEEFEHATNEETGTSGGIHSGTRRTFQGSIETATGATVASC